MSGVYQMNFPAMRAMFKNALLKYVDGSTDILKVMEELSANCINYQNIDTNPSIDCVFSSSDFSDTEGIEILKMIFHYYLRKLRVDPKKNVFDLKDQEDIMHKIMAQLVAGGFPMKCESFPGNQSVTESKSLLNTAHKVSAESVVESVTESVAVPVAESVAVPVVDKYAYQDEVVQKIISYYHSSNEARERGKIGYIVCPPGYGKTHITCKYLDWVHQSYDKVRVLIVTPQIEINREFTKVCDEYKISYLYIATSGDAHNIPESGILIVSYPMYARIESHIIKWSPSIIVQDEAHHIQCSEDEYNGEWHKVTKLTGHQLRLTATPKIFKDMNSQMYLGDLESDVIHSATLKDCIEKGLLCNYKTIVYKWSYEVVAELLIPFNRRYTVMFFNTCAAAKTAYDDFKHVYALYDQLELIYVDGKSSEDERALLRTTVPDGKYRIVFNVDIVSEGISIPQIDAVMFMESRKSSIRLMQNIGRCLRTYTGKSYALIIVRSDLEMQLNLVLQTMYYHGGINTVRAYGGDLSTVQETYSQVRLITRKCEQAAEARDWLSECIEYEVKYGRIMSTGKSQDHATKLYQWLKRVREHAEINLLHPEFKSKLESLISWKFIQPRKPTMAPMEWLAKCLEYERIHGEIKSTGSKDEVTSLYQWLKRMQRQYLKKEVSDVLLNGLGQLIAWRRLIQ